MDLVLKNRIAIVAASSDGLGKAIAFGLAREGAKLALCSRNAETINQTATEIAEATGAEILALPCDVSKTDDLMRLV